MATATDQQLQSSLGDYQVEPLPSIDTSTGSSTSQAQAYATEQQLLGRFGEYEIQQLASTDTGTLDSARIETALNDATAEMNSYLGQRYQVPISEASPMLVAVCCDIARYQLYAAQPTEEVTTRYQQRIAWLRDVANKKASLGIAERQASASALTVASVRSGGDRVFSRDALKDF